MIFDICMSCGSRYAYAVWGAKCGCDVPDVVHIEPCCGCGQLLGVLIDDDHHATDKIYCQSCVAKALALPNVSAAEPIGERS